MAISTRSVLGLAAAAALLGACATGPYYDNGYGYGYNNGYPYDNGYAYAPGPSYYDAPGFYEGPSVGLGIGFASGGSWDHEHHREWRGDRDGRHEGHGDRGGHEWHGGDHDGGHGGRDVSNDHGQNSGG
jgi:hypothetical protein